MKAGGACVGGGTGRQQKPSASAQERAAANTRHLLQAACPESIGFRVVVAVEACGTVHPVRWHWRPGCLPPSGADGRQPSLAGKGGSHALGSRGCRLAPANPGAQPLHIPPQYLRRASNRSSNWAGCHNTRRSVRKGYQCYALPAARGTTKASREQHHPALRRWPLPMRLHSAPSRRARHCQPPSSSSNCKQLQAAVHIRQPGAIKSSLCTKLAGCMLRAGRVGLILPHGSGGICFRVQCVRQAPPRGAGTRGGTARHPRQLLLQASWSAAGSSRRQTLTGGDPGAGGHSGRRPHRWGSRREFPTLARRAACSTGAPLPAALDEGGPLACPPVPWQRPALAGARRR
jgi:hypothetical protein